MSTPAFDFFLEFGAYCFENHSPEVSMNASTLIRSGIVGPGRRSSPRTLRTEMLRQSGLEGMLVRTMLRQVRRASVSSAECTSVLCFMPFGRRDYEGLVLPYLRRLAESGVRCGVVIPRPDVDRWVEVVAQDGTFVTTVVADAPLEIYRESRRTLAALRPALRDIAERFGLTATARRDVAEYFAQFALEKTLASRLIARLEPRVVLGLHFVANRGWQAAMSEAAVSGRRTTTVLVQHGAFVATGGFHDFEGADLVMLWGDRWRRELQRFATLPFRPVPAAVVTGNPKLGGPIGLGTHDARQPSTASSHPGRTRVLYVSSHVGGKTLMPPLAMVLEASKGAPGFEIVVKPHPAERDGALRTLVIDGELCAESVLTPRDALHACVLDAEVVVGPESTALFEAARLGKPVVLLSEAPTTAFKGFLTAADTVTLHATVDQLTFDARLRERVLDRQATVLRDAFGTADDPVIAGVEQLRNYIH